MNRILGWSQQALWPFPGRGKGHKSQSGLYFAHFVEHVCYKIRKATFDLENSDENMIEA